MQSAMVLLMCDARSRAGSWGTPNIWKTPARSWAGAASCWSQKSSPACGVCQILAKSCHSNSTSPMPAASVTQDRTSSGRVETTRTTNPPPQSCPTRSTGPSMRSSCAASQLAYSSIVAPKPAGRALSNPGSDSATASGQSSAANRPCQTAGVSGTPWTKTAVMAPMLSRRRMCLTKEYARLGLTVAVGVEHVLPGCSGQPLQCLLKVHGRTVAFVTGQLHIVSHGFDDLQTAAVLGGCAHRIAGQSTPAQLAGPAAALDGTGPAAGIDHLDDAQPVPDAHLHLVFLARPGVLNDVGAGLAERQRDVGARIRRDSQGLQAPVQNPAGDQHGRGIAGQVERHLDFHPSTFRPGISDIGRPLRPPDPLCLGSATPNPVAGLPSTSRRGSTEINRNK